MSYAPLDQEVLFSTTIREGPVVFAVWCAILASKDAEGMTSLNPESLVGIFSDPVGGRIVEYEPLKAAWEVLAGPDERSKNRDHGGRRIIPTEDGRWFVVSHEKYRIKHHRETRRLQVLDAKRRQREREKAAGNGQGKLEPAAEGGE